MRIRSIIIGLMALALVVAACGDDGDSDSNGSNGSSGDIEQPSGSDDGGGDSGGAGSGGESADLGDFPIPVPPNAVVDANIETDGVTAVNATFDAAEFDSVVAFYDDFTTSGSDTYQRTEAAGGGVIYTLTSGGPSEVRQILVSAPVPGDDTTFVSLAAGSQ